MSFFASPTIKHELEPTPVRRFWAYQWRHTAGVSGVAETSVPLTPQEFERELFRWNVAGAGQWQYAPYDPTQPARGFVL